MTLCIFLFEVFAKSMRVCHLILYVLRYSNSPHGGWSDGGCYVSHYNMWQTTCHCNHMTNFAVLREVPLPVTAARVCCLRM